MPYIPEKIVGFIGIDPDIVSSGNSGTTPGNVVDDHELLSNLLGGDGHGHYHVTLHQYEWLTLFFDNWTYAHHLTSLDGFNSLVDARIAAYLSNNQGTTTPQNNNNGDGDGTITYDQQTIDNNGKPDDNQNGDNEPDDDF